MILLMAAVSDRLVDNGHSISDVCKVWLDHLFLLKRLILFGDPNLCTQTTYEENLNKHDQKLIQRRKWAPRPVVYQQGMTKYQLCVPTNTPFVLAQSSSSTHVPLLLSPESIPWVSLKYVQCDQDLPWFILTILNCSTDQHLF